MGCKEKDVVRSVDVARTVIADDEKLLQDIVAYFS